MLSTIVVRPVLPPPIASSSLTVVTTRRRRHPRCLVRRSQSFCGQPQFLLVLMRFYCCCWLLVWIQSPRPLEALRHSFTTKNDRRILIGPVGVPFGFAGEGHYELTVSDFALKAPHTNLTSTYLLIHGLIPGFYLQRFPSESTYNKYLNLLQSNESLCSFDYFLDPVAGGDDDDDGDGGLRNNNATNTGAIGPPAKHGIHLMMTPYDDENPTINYTFSNSEAGLYFLTYQICVRDPSRAADANNDYDHSLSLLTKSLIRSSFELDFHFRNMVGGHVSYLPVGELYLPYLFSFFSLSYLVSISCCFIASVNGIV